MNSRARRLAPIILRLSLLAALLIACVLSFRAYVAHSLRPAIPATPDPAVARLDALVDLYRNGRISVIAISSATDFSWDRLYIFAAYTPTSSIDSLVGSSWQTNCSTRIEDVDGVTLLLFTKNGRVVHCLDYPGSNDFQVPWPPKAGGYSPDQAFFVLDDKGRLVLEGTR